MKYQVDESTIQQDGHHQILSGWHRWTAVGRAGLAQLPCWVRDMSDDEAFMELVLSNAQGELSPLELGIYVLQAISNGRRGRRKKGGLRAYARQLGRTEAYLRQLRDIAEVL